ncbi:MAG: hypothetical protein QXH81_03430 [Thermofilaceae archaeon]
MVKIVQKDWPPFVYVTIYDSKNNDVLHEHCTMFNPHKMKGREDLVFATLTMDFEEDWKWLLDDGIDFTAEIETNDPALAAMINKILDEMKKRYPPE